MSIEQRVFDVVKALLVRRKRAGENFSAQTMLYGGGLGLDSLGAAELSTMLEMAMGRDPYSEGQIPQTVGDVIRFYETSAGAATGGA